MQKELVYLKGFAKGKGYNGMAWAIRAADKLHDGQKRKSGEEYIVHPMKVTAELVALKVYDETVLSAALLHDVLEDCGITGKQLMNDYHIDKDTVEVVEEVTKSSLLPNDIYYANMRGDVRAILVKVSDRCHNISTMAGAFTPEKISEYICETKEYVLPLCKYAITRYPEYSDEILAMRNHIESVMYCAEYALSLIESKAESESDCN